MALIQFRELGDASDFVEAYNGKPFNAMEVSLFVASQSSGLVQVLCSNSELVGYWKHTLTH
jgi:hypothetical protein